MTGGLVRDNETIVDLREMVCVMHEDTTWTNCDPIRPHGRSTRARRLAKGVLAAAGAAVMTAACTGPATDDPASDGADSSSAAYEVLFVRHGSSLYEPPEMALSDDGVNEAASFAESVRGEPITSVRSSLILRAMQTADDIAKEHSLPLVSDPRLNEVGYELSELPKQDQGGRILEIEKTWLEGNERDNDFGGESYHQVEDRWKSWWSDYTEENAGSDGTGVVVAHGGILTLMLAEACEEEITPDFAITNRLDTTGFIRTQLRGDGTLTCTEWNGVPVPGSSDR
jgi:broad specificity phosphatase PhoE